jgi:cohesin domain-containing protein
LKPTGGGLAGPLRLLILGVAAALALGACDSKPGAPQKSSAPEKSGPAQKSGASGYVVSFKPNDSPDLVPARTLMLVEAPGPDKSSVCLDLSAKAVSRVAEVAFTVNFDPAVVDYLSYQRGDLLERKGKVAYQVALLPEPKGKLAVKIGYESGGAEADGTGKAVSLCFRAKADGRSDVALERGQILDARKTRVDDVTWVGGLLWVLGG